MRADGEDGPRPGPEAPPPGLEESLRTLGAEGRAGLKAAGDVAKALRILVAADITLALTGVAIAFGASSWLLVMAAMIAAMRSAGLSWLVALLVAALLSIGVTVAAAWGASRYFEHTRLKATRRQLGRLGFGELADLLPDPDSPESTEAAARRVAEAQAGDPLKKGLGVDVTPP